MSRTKGKKTLTVEFDGQLLAMLRAICDREKSSLGRIVRLACDAFAIDYLQRHGEITRIEIDAQGIPRMKRTFKPMGTDSYSETTEWLNQDIPSPEKTGWSRSR